MDRICTLSSNAGMIKLNVYKNQSEGVWGTLENIYCKDSIPCADLGDMLLKLDGLCEELSYPMADTQRRAFDSAPPEKRSAPKPELSSPVNAFNLYEQLRKAQSGASSDGGNQAVFYIQVLFRQHSTMQGNVLWAKKNQKQAFRSGLELMGLIASALPSKNPPHD